MTGLSFVIRAISTSKKEPSLRERACYIDTFSFSCNIRAAIITAMVIPLSIAFILLELVKQTRVSANLI